jgi:hypothetical protein
MTLFTGLTEEAKAGADLSPYDGKAVTEVHDLAEASRWIKRNAKKNGIYTIVLGADQPAEKLSFGYGGKRVTVTLASAGGKKTLTRSDGLQYPIITIKGKGTTFTLEDGITLSGTGEENNDAESLVKVDNGTFEMNGGIITGGENSGVDIEKQGSFVMNGGTITGNHSKTTGGGVTSKGTFTITGGAIKGNTAGWDGGGVYYWNGTFNMTGGIISGNTAGALGGGVCGVIRKFGGFFKSGGIIYGANASEALTNKSEGRPGHRNRGDAVNLSHGAKLAHYSGFDKTVTEKTELSSKDGYANWEWDWGW